MSLPDIVYVSTQDTHTARFVDSIAAQRLSLEQIVWPRFSSGEAYLELDPTDPDIVYVSNHSLRGLNRTLDGGQTFTSIRNGIDLTDPKAVDFPYIIDRARPNRLLLGTNRVYETTNRGDTWSPISTPCVQSPCVGGWTSQAVIYAVAAAATDVDTVYASTSDSHVFVTTDRGASWAQRDPAPDAIILDLLVDAHDSNTAIALDASRVWRTSNGGTSWTNITSDLPPDATPRAIEVDSEPALEVLYLGTSKGVYVSRNQGGAWTRLGVGMPQAAHITDLELNTKLGILAAGTICRGKWELYVKPPDVSFPVAASSQAEGTGAAGIPVFLAAPLSTSEVTDHPGRTRPSAEFTTRRLHAVLL